MFQPKVYFSGPDNHCESDAETKILVREVCGNLGLIPVFKKKSVPQMDLEELSPHEKRRISRVLFLYDLIELYDCDILIADLNPKVKLEPDIEVIMDISHAWHQRIPSIGYVKHVNTYSELNVEQGSSSYIEPFDYPVHPRLAEQCTEILYGSVLKAILRANSILNHEYH